MVGRKHERLESRVVPVVFRIADHSQQKKYTLDNTSEYLFDAQYDGKFVIASHPLGNYFAAVSSPSGEPILLGHELVFDLLKLNAERCQGVAKKELRKFNIKGGGYVTISPCDETILFYGFSSGYNLAFLRDDVIPVAKEAARKSGGLIKTAAIISEDDQEKIAEAMGQFPTKGPLACVFNNLGKGAYRSKGFYQGIMEILGNSLITNGIFVNLTPEK
jgi:hypothetical protein